MTVCDRGGGSKIIKNSVTYTLWTAPILGQIITNKIYTRKISRTSSIFKHKILLSKNSYLGTFPRGEIY